MKTKEFMFCPSYCPRRQFFVKQKTTVDELKPFVSPITPEEEYYRHGMLR